MRLCFPLIQPRAQCIDLRVQQRRGFPSGAGHQRQHAWDFQNAHAFLPSDAHKNITRKKRQIQFDARAVVPLPLRPVQRQIMFHIAQIQMLRDAFLMPRSCRDGKPLGRRRNSARGRLNESFL